jgi:transcriptional regulator with XRE-family HTH domain
MKGADLREIRRLKGWTQARAAEYARVTPNTWARWERDEVPIPGPATALLEPLLEGGDAPDP